MRCILFSPVILKKSVTKIETDARRRRSMKLKKNETQTARQRCRRSMKLKKSETQTAQRRCGLSMKLKKSETQNARRRCGLQVILKISVTKTGTEETKRNHPQWFLRLVTRIFCVSRLGLCISFFVYQFVLQRNRGAGQSCDRRKAKGSQKIAAASVHISRKAPTPCRSFTLVGRAQ